MKIRWMASTLLTLLPGGAAMAQDTLTQFFQRMHCPRPEYPAAAARKETQGTVAFSIIVGEDSRVTGVEITQGSGDTREHRLLDRTVKETFSNCVWRGEVPVPPGSYSGHYVFQLSPVTEPVVRPRR